MFCTVYTRKYTLLTLGQHVEANRLHGKFPAAIGVQLLCTTPTTGSSNQVDRHFQQKAGLAIWCFPENIV